MTSLPIHFSDMCSSCADGSDTPWPKGAKGLFFGTCHWCGDANQALMPFDDLQDGTPMGWGYIVAMILALLVALFIISYSEGRTAEAARESTERYEIIDTAVADRDAWRAKYDSLSHETDWLTVVDAQAKLHGGNQ